ncbi:Glycine--tRNA ligase beta subunit [Campylobacter majalis]|uniref:Glycine--tRNA ligase beta subunit n=1 Tax=Campylobacter majalis TaxID=2790656 RepID=A0ABN7K5B4_9BACT|nr:glycine--tRNA ligase subunit beta [Campylobacter majalis]CAD7287674.1 Glycine--tRNA ligase beta subunit [Campylobacter majalis]
MKELLIEITVEELPAIPFLKELPNIKTKWQTVLDEYKLKSEFDFYYTPRRLVFFHKDFKAAQDDSIQEFIGAPKHVAVKDGAFTQAALAFAKKCEISQDELGFKQIDGKEVLYHIKQIKGRESKELLGEMIEKFLHSLNFGKSMRWGSGEHEFIRPIRSFLCFFDGKNVEFSAFGVKSEPSTYAHRSISYEKIAISSVKEYFDGLKERGIVLDANERKQMILVEFNKIQDKHDISIEIDGALLDEVVAITEYPTALLGEFGESFLDMPSEVIITSMKENQRYFAVFKNQKLTNNFVVVSNAITKDNDLIIKGNEKVLRARLSDAMFFWQSDLASGLDPEKLKNITYLKELGSMYDKTLREIKIAEILSSKFNLPADKTEQIKRAIMLSKADLTTAMVYEFGELQGVMGGYYAKAMGESDDIVKAIKEQYLPDGENAKCPTSTFSAVVALSNKLDTLVGLFGIGKIPTGTKDPYALRRAANGVIKIAQSLKLDFDVREILALIAKDYSKFELKTLESFIIDRLYTFFDCNASIVKSCINSGERDINRLTNAINSLSEISAKPGFSDNFSTFKRLANIIKDAEISSVDVHLFENEYEKKLNDSFMALDKNDDDFVAKLNGLFGLKADIDSFFDNVMINVDDKKIKENRIALIGQIYKEFLKVADIKEISF